MQIKATLKNNKSDMIAYLRGVGMLEWHIRELIANIHDIEERKRNLFIKRTFSKTEFYPFSHCAKAFFKSFIIAALTALVGWFVFFEIASATVPESLSNSMLAYIIVIVIYVLSIAIFLFMLIRFNSGFKLIVQYFKNKINNIKDYRSFVANEKKRIKDAPLLAEQFDDQISCLLNYIERTEYELEAAYSLDILYLKYRTFETVYAMYEYFVSGSVDNLKEAINKYDQESRLDDIRATLGEINERTKMVYDEMLYQTQLAQENNQLLQQQLANSEEIIANTKMTAFNTGALLLIEEQREIRRQWGF